MGQSLDWIKDKYEQKDYASMLTLILYRFPQLTYPGGEEAYNSATYLKQEAWREVGHFIGGAFLGLILPFYIVLPVMFCKEVFYDKLESGWIKAIMDTVFWTLGCLFANLL